MKRSGIAAVLIAVPLLAVGCAPEAPEIPATEVTAAAPSPSSTTMDGMLPPAIVAPTDLEGTEQRVVLGTSLVLTVPEGTESQWTGTTADVAIAEFNPGGPSEGAVFQPGFLVRAVGTTTATLTGPDGQTVSFTIDVVPY